MRAACFATSDAASAAAAAAALCTSSSSLVLLLWEDGTGRPSPGAAAEIAQKKSSNK